MLVGTLLSPARGMRRPPFVPDGGGGEPEPDLRLLWSPTELSNPTVVNVPADTGGYVEYSFEEDEDVRLVLPNDQKRVGGITVTGGRHIELIGGEIEPEASPPNNPGKRCLYLREQTGNIFLQGIHIHPNSNGDAFDGIYILAENGTTGTVTIQDCRIEVYKGADDFHSDCIQVQDSSYLHSELRVHRTTFVTDYQAFYNLCEGTDGINTFKQVNFKRSGGSGAMLWIGDNGTNYWSRRYVSLEDAYLETSRHMFDEIRPNDGCADEDEIPDLTNGVVTWPNSAYITGSLIEGAPPNGDWCPEGVAGFAYVNPGYL